MAFSKWSKVREVTFNEDYRIGRKVIYAKGSTHYMRVETAEKLESEGVSIVIKKYDKEAGTAKAKERLGIKD